MTFENGTWLNTAVSCTNCDYEGYLIINRDKTKTEEELAVTLEAKKNILGEQLSLSCINQEFRERGDCPMSWDLVHYINDEP